MQSLVSEFYVYNSTGRLLSGEGEVYSNEYTNLAKQIDSKRNALYFELSHEEGVLILGCSVMVEEVGGREERIVCVGKYSGYNGHESALITQFYETVSSEISHLQKLEYRLVGLWEENDISDFSGLKELIADEITVEYIFGKLLANEKVSIKSANAVSAVSLINSVFATIGNSLEADLKFMASQYPYDTDISICPIEPNPDFELEEHVLKWKSAPHYSEYYVLLPGVFKEHESDIKASLQANNRINLSFTVKNFTFRFHTWDILDLFATSESLYRLFELYKGDVSTLVQIFKERSIQIKQMPMTNEVTIANIFLSYSNHLSQNSIFSNMGEDEALRSLFERIRNAGVKKQLDIALLKNRGLWSYVIKDTIRRIYAGRDVELLNALCSVGFTRGDYGGEKFSKNVAAALSSYDNEKLVVLLKIVGENIRTAPATGGQIFVDYISTQLRAYDLSSDLTTTEAENLDRYFNTKYVAAKQKAKTKKKQNMMMLASYGIVAMILIAGIAYVFLNGGPMAVYTNLTGGNNSAVDGNLTDQANLSYVNNSVNDSENTVQLVNDSFENSSVNGTNETSGFNSSTSGNETNETPGFVEVG